MKTLVLLLTTLLLTAAIMEPALARPRHHHRQHRIAQPHVYHADADNGGQTYDIVAGSNKVRINGVGQVITGRRP